MKLWTVLPTSQHDVAPTLCLRAHTLHAIFHYLSLRAMAPIRRSSRTRRAPFRYTDNGTRSAPTDPRINSLRKVHVSLDEYLSRDPKWWDPLGVCFGTPGGAGCSCQARTM